MKRKRALQLRAAIEQAATSLPDEDALEAVELFPAWTLDMDYDVGFRVRYGDKLYRVIQSHTSQADWTPDITPALYTEVSIAEWPEWKQPLGAEDAYHAGDKVAHLDRHWVSDVDNNVWEPSVYGWTEEVSL